MGERSEDDKKIYDALLTKEITGLLIFNSFLLVYSWIKLAQAKKNVNQAKKNPNKNQLQTTLLTIFCFAIFSRCSYQVFLLYHLLKSEKPSIFVENCFRILDNMPTLLFVTISCIFSHIWHRVYSKFQKDDEDDYEDEVRAKPFNLKKWLIVFNIVVYSISVILITNNFMTGLSKDSIDPMHILFCICTFLMTILLGITGSRFHRRTVRWLKQMGNTVKSTKGFTIMFGFLILCCIITFFRQIIIFYCRITYNRSAGEQIAMAPTNIHDILHICYLVTVFVIGESLPFLLLIRLLDSKTKKSQMGRFSQKAPLNYSMEAYDSNRTTSLL